MNTFTKEEYLALVEKLAEDHYGDDGDNEPITEMEWIPSESDYARKVHLVNKDGTIDLITAKKDKVRKVLLEYKYANLAIGNFLIRITNYHGKPNSKTGADISLDISLYQKVSRTPNGGPCNMLNKFDVFRDSRFEGRPWLTHFNGYGAHKVPLETMVDIIRWIQVIQNLTAFL